MLKSKVILWFCVSRRLQTQFATQQILLVQLEAVHLGLPESDWLPLGSLHCVESPVEVRQEGPVLEVMGQVKQNFIDTMCWQMSVLPTVSHGFLSPLHFLIIGFRTEANSALSGVSLALTWAERGKEAIWKLWGCRPLTDGLAEPREADTYSMLKMAGPPTPVWRDQPRLEPYHNKWTHTQALTQGKRGQPHGNSLWFILF